MPESKEAPKFNIGAPGAEQYQSICALFLLFSL